MRWYFFTVVLCGLVSCRAQKAQQVAANRYGLKVIQNLTEFRKTSTNDSLQKMVALKSYLHPLHTNFVYATSNNFTHQVLYKNPEAYLQKEAAQALQKVQDSLQILGYDIKIFDAYRPYSITEKMWEIVPDDRYAANPANGSGHNRGVAVDLTLVEKATGREIPMPTGFDNFTDSAHHNFMNLSAEVLQNRKLLKIAMEQYGFVALPTEWWHYSLPNAKRYDLLNISFDELKKVTNE